MTWCSAAHEEQRLQSNTHPQSVNGDVQSARADRRPCFANTRERRRERCTCTHHLLDRRVRVCPVVRVDVPREHERVVVVRRARTGTVREDSACVRAVRVHPQSWCINKKERSLVRLVFFFESNAAAQQQRETGYGAATYQSASACLRLSSKWQIHSQTRPGGRAPVL